MKQFCLVGCGYWGKNILRTLSTKISYVCEVNPEITQKLKLDYPHLQFLDSWITVLNHQEIAHIIIALPAEMHYQFTKEALEHGKNVFVEKPLSIYLDEVKELDNLSQKMNKVLFLGHLLHYHPFLNEITKIIKNGDLGPIRHIKARRQSLGIFRKYDNVLWTVGIHDLSWLTKIFDLTPNTPFTAVGDNITGHSDLDYVTVSIKVSDGLTIEQHCSWIAPAKEQTLYIYGEKGAIYANDVTKEFYLMDYTGKKTPIEAEKTLPLTVEMEAFVEVCEGETTSLLTGVHEMLPVYHLLDTINQSLKCVRSAKVTRSLESSSEVNVPESSNSKYYVDPTSILDEGVEIGEGSKVWQWCHLSKNSQLGQNCNLGQGCYLGDSVSLGDGCRLQNNVNIYTGVKVGKNVFFGPNCTTTNDKQPSVLQPCQKYLETIIEDEVSIGAGAVICPGIRLGKACLIGAGAIVTRDVEPGTIVVGNPARPISK